MIPVDYITEWRNFVKWNSNEQVEQDLIISRAIVDIFNNDFLKEKLAFRGGTAIHKLFISPQLRYSEDIDLVQKESGPIKKIIDTIQATLHYLGPPNIEQKRDNNVIVFRFSSEIQPVVRLKLKVEINCREHFTVLGYENKSFEVSSSWFRGSCELLSYSLEELLGSKLRALYQRKKGRDLYDIYKCINTKDLYIPDIIKCYKKYISFSVNHPPSQKQFVNNLKNKLKDSEFTGDVKALLNPAEYFDFQEAFESVNSNILNRI